jgi:hypothetical protein
MHPDREDFHKNTIFFGTRYSTCPKVWDGPAGLLTGGDRTTDKASERATENKPSGAALYGSNFPGC